MDDELPQDPFTTLAEGASQIHELYEAYVTAGFTPAQAMQLVCATITASMNGQP